MVRSTCNICGGNYHWHWTEAFDKFGFQDGDGQVETHQVGDILSKAGYEVEIATWGLHNTIITTIKLGDHVLMSEEDPNYTVGYDNPRNYLPDQITELLDKTFPE